MEIRLIDHSSSDYEAMINLRLKVLLEPLNVPASYVNREKEKEDFLIGAFENNELIGCCILTPKDNNLIQLRQMAVREDQQGKGIGAEVLQFAEEVAKQNGFRILMMHARNPVINFYRKSGYEIVGEEFFEVGMGHHKMQKSL
jgi:N-acetylglutamate synthase-like GNAT family acetyltransferase